MNKSIDEVKAKIQKLFAMADPESGAAPAEVESAMVAARKLMFKYKLSKADIVDENDAEIITTIVNEISFSTQTNPWIIRLINIIGDNYCCHPCSSKGFRAKTRCPGFIGYKDDVDFAVEVLKCATNIIFKEHKKIRSKATAAGASYAEGTAMCNAIGNGFVRGLKEKFEEQNYEERETGFALVMTTPQEVEDYVKGNFKSGSFNSGAATAKARKYDALAVKGYKMGKEFSMNDKIAAMS